MRYITLLSASGSFARGMASVLDFGGTLPEYNTHLSPEQADALAIESDWRVVGQELASAFDAIREQNKGVLDGAR